MLYFNGPSVLSSVDSYNTKIGKLCMSIMLCVKFILDWVITSLQILISIKVKFFQKCAFSGIDGAGLFQLFYLFINIIRKDGVLLDSVPFLL